MVIKRNGNVEKFNIQKVYDAVQKAADSVKFTLPTWWKETIKDYIYEKNEDLHVEEIQDAVEKYLMSAHFYEVARAYILWREKHKHTRENAKKKQAFIQKYAKSSNTANASIDDNSNVANKNIAVLNSEMYKEENIDVNRYRVMMKLQELYPDFDYKQYVKDIRHHTIYKNDENSTFGFPYCVATTMYPFLTEGIKSIGGLSAEPHNIDSFCGMFVNYVFAISTQFAGAVATPEFLLCMDYFCRKAWGDNYYQKPEVVISSEACLKKATIKSQIHQYFQQIVYSINQPAAARGYQSVFWNVAIFDKPFYEGMFSNFFFPDGTQPQWESLCWLQKEFMKWFNAERLKTILTFPVVSASLLFKDSQFEDEEMADFLAEEYSEGDSFFTYMSDSVDSLSSCCRLKNKIQTKEFNFTNGNLGVMTGSKSVITLNLNRIIQDFFIDFIPSDEDTEGEEKIKSRWKNSRQFYKDNTQEFWKHFAVYLNSILERVYKYHTAYNELLWDLYDEGLLPAYSAGFIDLNKQYLTIGINGLTASAEFLGLECSDNSYYKTYCQNIFGLIKQANLEHKTKKTNFNTECIPAESCGVKLYNADKAEGYWVPEDINLYTSYIYKPYDSSVSVLEKLRLHGSEYIGDYLDGGSAAHINLDAHPSKEQCKKLLEYAAKVGCQYWTINVPNTECTECGFISKHPLEKCPKCGSTKLDYWDRIIGYLTKIKNWSEARQIEGSKRIYHNTIE